MANFLKAVKSRNRADLNADVSVGVTSADLVHMANISYRVGRKLNYDAASGSFTGDAEANAMMYAARVSQPVRGGISVRHRPFTGPVTRMPPRRSACPRILCRGRWWAP